MTATDFQPGDKVEMIESTLSRYPVGTIATVTTIRPGDYVYPIELLIRGAHLPGGQQYFHVKADEIRKVGS